MFLTISFLISTSILFMTIVIDFGNSELILIIFMGGEQHWKNLFTRIYSGIHVTRFCNEKSH